VRRARVDRAVRLVRGAREQTPGAAGAAAGDMEGAYVCAWDLLGAEVCPIMILTGFLTGYR
jgi:hypothetical protein